MSNAERPQVAVPAHRVERVVAVVVGRDPVARADVDHEVAMLVDRLPELGGVEVALGVRRVLEQLAVVVAIPLRRLDLRRRLQVQDPLLGPLVRVQAPRRPDRQHEVVARVVREVAEDRAADAGPLVDEQHLVGHAVAVEPVLGHRLGGPNDPEHDVVVEVQRDTAGDRVALRGNVARVRQPMAVEAVVGGLQLDPRAGLQLVRLGGRRHVVQERAPPREPFDAEQLLGVQAAVGSAVLRVALARDGASRDVVHGRAGLLGVRTPV